MPNKIARARKPRAIHPPTSHALWAVIGVSVGLAWTAVGCLLALVQGVVVQFLQEWARLQGFFLITLGTWLLFIIRASVLKKRISSLTTNGQIRFGPTKSRIFKFTVVGLIGGMGTASLIYMGFNATGILLIFMWITCTCICFTAGIVTLHAFGILIAVYNLQRQDIKVFRYSPARTPELRGVVSYFSSFGLLTTIGYAFALFATFKAHWTGPRDYVEAVRLFWPLIYVPICTFVLIFPHFVVHKLIQREKERTLQSCQQDIDNLLSKYADLKTDEIDRTNTLAQLFDRIAATPNYVIDFGIAVRTALPLAFNLITLFVKAYMGQP